MCLFQIKGTVHSWAKKNKGQTQITQHELWTFPQPECKSCLISVFIILIVNLCNSNILNTLLKPNTIKLNILI